MLYLFILLIIIIIVCGCLILFTYFKMKLIYKEKLYDNNNSLIDIKSIFDKFGVLNIKDDINQNINDYENIIEMNMRKLNELENNYVANNILYNSLEKDYNDAININNKIESDIKNINIKLNNKKTEEQDIHNIILPYYGSYAPNGWVECDGTNLTPDLRGRLIVNKLNNNDVNNIGGKSNLSLNKNNIYHHRHNTTLPSPYNITEYNNTIYNDDININNPFIKFKFIMKK